MKLNLSTKFLLLAALAVGTILLSHISTNAAAITETSDQKIRSLLALEFISILIALAVPLYTIRKIFKPQRQMIEAMHRIAQGDTDTVIPHTQRNDEMGEMARALTVFRENARNVEMMADEKVRREHEVEMQKRKAIHDMATNFEIKIKNIAEDVAVSAQQMDATTKAVAATTGVNKNKLANLSKQIGEANNNMSLVSGSLAELTDAITGINTQVGRASTITAIAVDEARKADRTVTGLIDAAQKIGEVIAMINAIAEQINLLALNATIEAARAGEAGKGFAVVASEVKNLATQTTKATEQIGQYITSIQNATKETAGVMKSIGGTINEINDISTSIHTAVSAQGNTTHSISLNVESAAQHATEIAANAADATTASKATEEAASLMLVATGRLTAQSESLKKEMGSFLTDIRNQS